MKQLNMNIEVKGDYGCPCGSTDLSVSAQAQLSMKKGKIEGEVANVSIKDMDKARMTCEECGFSGPGYLFNKQAHTRETVQGILVRYIAGIEAAHEFVLILKTLQAATGLTVHECSGDTYELHLDRPKPEA